MAAAALEINRFVKRTSETCASAENMREMFFRVRSYESAVRSFLVLLQVRASTWQTGRKLRFVCDFASTHRVGADEDKADLRRIVVNLNGAAGSLYGLTDQIGELSHRLLEGGPLWEQRVLQSMLDSLAKETERQACDAEDAAETLALASSEKFMNRLEHELRFRS